MRDIINNLAFSDVESATVASAAATVCVTDLQGFGSVGFAFTVADVTGSNKDATIIIEESDAAETGYTAAPDASLIGNTLPAFLGEANYKVGYVGNKRYVRAKIDRGTETSVTVNAVSVRGHAGQAPV